MSGYEYEDCNCHPWCSNSARDIAVRAAEDKRTGPLPTLEECIERQTARPCGGTDPAPLGGEPNGAVNGLRTERVTLEVTHHCRFPLADWLLEIVAEFTSDPGESVRVVEESAPAASVAAGTEADAWGVRRKGGVDAVVHRLFRSNAEASAEQYGGTVVPLYAAPQSASGWLTEEEREMVQSWEQHYRQGSHYAQSPSHNWFVATEMGKRAKVCESILARSTPPEVVAPASYAVEHPQPPRDLEWRAALAAAGVPVKEVG